MTAVAARAKAASAVATGLVRQVGPAVGKLVTRPAKAPAPATTPSAGTTKPATAARPNKWVMIGAVATVAAIVIAAVAAGVFLSNRPVATGTVFIDASPWGQLKSVTRADGKPVTGQVNGYTPIALPLDIGDYEITLTGPDGAEKSVKVSVQENAAVEAPVAVFGEITPEDYFERYLAPTAALPVPGDPAAVEPDGAAPANAPVGAPSAPVKPVQPAGAAQ
jgi:hypothetical protein